MKMCVYKTDGSDGERMTHFEIGISQWRLQQLPRTEYERSRGRTC
jgi:hypothetical protein